MNLRNVSASIRQRLLNYSKEHKRPFLEVLQYFAIERFLYRLSLSPHAHKFYLKGALMFRAWQTSVHRPTMDIDLLGKTSNSPGNLRSICAEICQQHSPCPDGISFRSTEIQATTIQTSSEYEGVRIEFFSELDRAQIKMQIDVGFGDLITPAPQLLHYPSLLDLPAPQLYGYTPETVFAEKLETVVKRGMLNTRIKDIFDLWMLSRAFTLDASILHKAIHTTFKQRGTPVPASSYYFPAAFVADPAKVLLWNSFIRRAALPYTVPDLPEIIQALSSFLQSNIKNNLTP